MIFHKSKVWRYFPVAKSFILVIIFCEHFQLTKPIQEAIIFWLKLNHPSVFYEEYLYDSLLVRYLLFFFSSLSLDFRYILLLYLISPEHSSHHLHPATCPSVLCISFSGFIHVINDIFVGAFDRTSFYEIVHACMLTIMISGRWNGPLGRTSVRISPLLRTKLCQIELNYDSEVSSSSFLRSHLPRHSWFKEICLYVNTSIYFASFRIERFLVWKGYIYFLHILHCQGRNYLGDCISSVLFAF